MNRLDLTYLTDADPDEALKAAAYAEQKAHLEFGWYVPTREELMDTTGEFFAHLIIERE